MAIAAAWIRRLSVAALIAGVVAGGWYAVSRTPWGRLAWSHIQTFVRHNTAPMTHKTTPPTNNSPPTQVFPPASLTADRMLQALRVQVLQTRSLPGAWAQYGPAGGLNDYMSVWVDVQLRVTNTSAQPIHLTSAYIEGGCYPFLQNTLGSSNPALLLPLADQLFTVSAQQLAADDRGDGAGAARDPGEYLNLAPHQTKVGWITAEYITNCGSSPNLLLFSDDSPAVGSGGWPGPTVSFSVPIRVAGPPLALPSHIP